MGLRAPRQPSSWGSFLAWALVGGGYALGSLSILTIGGVVLVVSVVATVILARSRLARAGRYGIVSGLSLPLFYVAFLNREGPGWVCASSAVEVSCGEASNPWPWLMAGTITLATGLILHARRQAQLRR